MRPRLTLLVLILSGALLSAQATTPVTVAWDLNPTHVDATWELEIDGASQPCGSVTTTATDTRCTASAVTYGTHSFRLRGSNTSGAGAWSTAITATIAGPGPFTIRSQFEGAGIPPPPPPAMSSVAYVSDVDKTPATGTSIVYTSFAVSGANPVILVPIAIMDRTATVSSVVVSAGLTAGTPVEVATVRNDQGADHTFLSIWAIPAPSGTGTITATLSASVPWQSNAILMSGADQTTPCPSADAVSATGNASNPLVVTPANLTANDAAVGMGANGNAGDNPTWNQTQTFQNNTTVINAAAGYHLGTGSVSVTWGTPATVDALLAVRVAAATAAATKAPPIFATFSRPRLYRKRRVI